MAQTAAFWALIAVAVVTTILIVVGALMLARLLEVRKMETAMRNAWNSVGVCSNDNCKLAVNDKLAAYPDTVSSAYNPVVSRRLMDYVARVSLPSTMNKSQPTELLSPPGDHLVATLTPSAGPHFGGVWLGPADKMLTIAFRGTVTDEEIDRDLEVVQTEFRGSQVHQGFLKVHLRYYDQIRQLVEDSKHTVEHVFMAGHSLGGAVAQLTLLALALDFPGKQFTAYAFGTPRVGDESFGERIRQVNNAVALWREVNKGDVLQEMPPMVMPNLKNPMGSLLLYDHAGESNVFKTQWGTWKHNHSLACYIDHVDQRLRVDHKMAQHQQADENKSQRAA